MRRILISIVLINIFLNLCGQTVPNHYNLGLHGLVTWVDSTHIIVEYDWSNDSQLLDWVPGPGTTIVRGNGIVNVSGGTSTVWFMQWKQGIKCSRILAENVKTGPLLHVNIYTNNIDGFFGEWNPAVNIGVVLRGFGSIWQVNGEISDLLGYEPIANTAETYDLNISELGMTFKSSRDNVLHSYTGALEPILDRIIALGAYQSNTEWGKVTIEGEVTAPWQNEPVPSNFINIQSNGTSFAPILEVIGNPVIEWVFDDGTTSASVNPIKNYGSARSRHNYVKVTPWSAVVGLNLGYDASDGGYSPNIKIHPSQNVVGFQNFGFLKGSLKRLSMSYNPITELDLTDFMALEFIELYQCMSLRTLDLGTHPNLERLCVEDCNLPSLDISGCSNLKDLRCALNNFTSVKWGTIGQSLWHICIRDNPSLSTNIPALSQFPALKELLTENTSQSGAFVCHSSIIYRILSYDNHYTSADISGCTSLSEFLFSGNQLASLVLGTANDLIKVEFKDCGLTEALTDYVLHTLDNAGLSNGYADLAGNNAPSAEGLDHYYKLKEKGWTIVISEVAVTDMNVSVPNGTTLITRDNGTLQFKAEVFPANATNKTVTWFIESGTGLATINDSGLLTAINNGTVSVMAKSNDGTGVFGTINVTITNQSEPPKIIVNSKLITIRLNDDFAQWQAFLYNNQGCIVLSRPVNSDIVEFDASSLLPGIYIVVVSKGDNIRVAKVIKP
jgi:hypothetical protein